MADATLTKEEQLNLEVLRVKRENLQLRVQVINSQIQAEQTRINEQHNDLVKGVFKAHGASDTEYQLNDVETVLVPVDKKSVAGKGEGKKVTVGKFDNK